MFVDYCNFHKLFTIHALIDSVSLITLRNQTSQPIQAIGNDSLIPNVGNETKLLYSCSHN